MIEEPKEEGYIMQMRMEHGYNDLRGHYTFPGSTFATPPWHGPKLLSINFAIIFNHIKLFPTFKSETCILCNLIAVEIVNPASISCNLLVFPLQYRHWNFPIFGSYFNFEQTELFSKAGHEKRKHCQDTLQGQRVDTFFKCLNYHLTLSYPA